MADVTQSVSIFQQIRLVAGLRWRILRNSLRKKSNLLDLLGLIFAGVIGGVLVIGLCFAFYAGGYAFLSQGHLEWIAFLFWGIFLFWQVFPVFVAGFGANFEFRTLLRFPLSLSAFYIIGLAYGFADFSSLASICWLLSMTAGAAVAKPGVLPAMLLIVTLFMLLNVTAPPPARHSSGSCPISHGCLLRLRVAPLPQSPSFIPGHFYSASLHFYYMWLCSALSCGAVFLRNMAVKSSVKPRPRRVPPSVPSL